MNKKIEFYVLPSVCILAYMPLRRKIVRIFTKWVRACHVRIGLFHMFNIALSFRFYLASQSVSITTILVGISFFSVFFSDSEGVNERVNDV